MTKQRQRRPIQLLLAAGLGVLALSLHACESVLLVEPSPPPVAGVMLLHSVSAQDGFERALQQVDQAQVGVSRDGRTVVDTILNLEPGEASPRLYLDLEVSAPGELFVATLALASGQGRLFDGEVEFRLRPGITTTVEVSLDPVVTAVQVPDSLPVIDALNDTVQLSGSALFATGDPIPDSELVWSSLNPDIVEVSRDGLLVSRQEGEAGVIAESAGQSGSLTARVRGKVQSVSIHPAGLTMDLGNQVQLEARILDRRDNRLSGREVTWRSADPSIASVDSEGEITGMADGSTSIFAESEGVVGSTAVTVVRPEVVRIEISPENPVLAAGETVHLSAVSFDASGAEVPGVEPAWSTTNPETAEVSSEGVVTALASGSTVVRAQVDDAVGEVTVAVREDPAITTRSLPDAVIGVQFNRQLAATGGISPYTWTVIEGTLPPGLSLDTSTGRITGTPSTAGRAEFTVRVTDGSGVSDDRALSITVQEAEDPPPPPPDDPPQIATESLPGGAVGAPYSAQLAATDGEAPYAWSRTGGALPAGLSLDTTTGRITGTPSAAGSVEFTIQVTDGNGASDARTLGITISDNGPPDPGAPTVTTAELPVGMAGQGYGLQLGANGGEPPYVWSIDDGSLPAGLELDAASGQIIGTPTAAGTANFAVRVTGNDGRSSTRGLHITVADEGDPSFSSTPSITTDTLPDGVEGGPYSVQLGATYGTLPYSWSVTEGTLPAGLSLDASTGQITGTPTTAGSTELTVQVTDDAGASDARGFGVTVQESEDPPPPDDPPQITTESLPGGIVGASYSAQLAATDGTAPYSWSITEGALPAGLSLDAASGQITGTPSTAGSVDFTIQVTDGSDLSDAQPLGITISDEGPPPSEAPSVTTAALPDGTVGQGYNAQLGANGGEAPYVWSIDDGSLPAGLELDAASGQITGTPTAPGTANFTVRVTGSDALSSTRGLHITVADEGDPPPSSTPSITTESLPDGIEGEPYNVQLGATDGTLPYSWSVTEGTLPAGLSLDASTGQITGTPTTAGSTELTVQVTDDAGASDARGFGVTVQESEDPPPPPDDPPQITTESLPGGVVGASYSAQLAATDGTAPYSWSITEGALPAGLSLDASGQITGTPSTAGSVDFTIQVTDGSDLSDAQPLSLTIVEEGEPPPGAPWITTSALPEGQLGQGYAVQLGATGGRIPYTWSISDGALPAGLALDEATGQVTGTPTATGTAGFTVRVTGSDGPSSIRAFGITVAATSDPPPPLDITTETLPDGAMGIGYGMQLSASGGSLPYSWSVTGGALPAGLSLDASTGQITGTPATAGTVQFTLQVTGSSGLSDARELSITIRAQGSPAPEAPSGLIRDVHSVDGTNHFRLRWTDNSTSETRYEVERKIQGEFVLIAVLPAGSTEFLERVVGGHPRYRVRACNGSGCSAWITD